MSGAEDLSPLAEEVATTWSSLGGNANEALEAAAREILDAHVRGARDPDELDRAFIRLGSYVEDLDRLILDWLEALPTRERLGVAARALRQPWSIDMSPDGVDAENVRRLATVADRVPTTMFGAGPLRSTLKLGASRSGDPATVAQVDQVLAAIADAQR